MWTRSASPVALLALAALMVSAGSEPVRVRVEFVVEDARRRPVADLDANEVVVHQGGDRERIESFERRPGPGHYALTYVPVSGRPGAVMLRLLRPGTMARGPDGPALKVQVLRPLDPVEGPLLAALDAPEEPRDLEHESFVLRFERHPDGLHHTFAVELPLRNVKVDVASGQARAHVALMARIRTAEGRDVQRFSLDYPIELPEMQKLLLPQQRVVWTTHLHLPAGGYVLESAGQDLLSARTGVRRVSFEVAPPSAGLRMSSISVMQAAESLSKEQGGIDNPLEYMGHQLVPARRPQYVAGGLGELRFFVMLYPDASAKEPVDLSLQLHRDGALVGRGPVKLPAAEAGQPIAYLGSFPLQTFAVGAYNVKLQARQGSMSAEETAAFDLVPPPRIESIPRELRLSNAGLTLGLVPGLGGRIVELRPAGGENLLDADPRFWKEPFPPADLRTPFEPWNGHTYWVGPQSAWWTQQDLDPERRHAKATWPPDPFHETARYEVRESSRSKARLESPLSPITGLRRELEVELAGARRVRIRVSATNGRTTPVAWSIYSNTRVRPDGWAYVRLARGGIKRIDGPRGTPAYPHRVLRGFFASPPGVKPARADTARTADAFLRPAEPQIAYFRAHQLFLKRTENFSETRLHPEETLVELYRSSGGRSDGKLLELEMHGPYETLPPGQTISFVETWELVEYSGAGEPGAHVEFLERLAAAR
jgi:Domain of unknown function (DUF4380)